jgi:hypothetical protein
MLTESRIHLLLIKLMMQLRRSMQCWTCSSKYLPLVSISDTPTSWDVGTCGVGWRTRGAWKERANIWKQVKWQHTLEFAVRGLMKAVASYYYHYSNLSINKEVRRWHFVPNAAGTAEWGRSQPPMIIGCYNLTGNSSNSCPETTLDCPAAICMHEVNNLHFPGGGAVISWYYIYMLLLRMYIQE